MATDIVTEREEMPPGPPARPRISWGAVFAGAVTALAAQLLLSLLGLGIGAATVKPTTQDNPLHGLGYLAIIWWLATGTASLFAGGWVAGKLAGVPREEAAMHGVVAWGLTAVLGFYLLTTGVGNLIGGAARIMGQGAALMAGTGAVAAMRNEGADQGGIDLEPIRREARALLRDTNPPGTDAKTAERKTQEKEADARRTARRAAEDPLKADEEFRGLLTRVFRGGDVDKDEREALVNLVANRTGKSREEAERTVQNWEELYQKARDRAREAGDKVARATMLGAFWSFFTLLLGAVAAGWGSYVAAPHTIVVTRVPARVTV